MNCLSSLRKHFHCYLDNLIELTRVYKFGIREQLACHHF